MGGWFLFMAMMGGGGEVATPTVKHPTNASLSSGGATSATLSTGGATSAEID
jgi:hypothetical protein